MSTDDRRVIHHSSIPAGGVLIGSFGKFILKYQEDGTFSIEDKEGEVFLGLNNQDMVDLEELGTVSCAWTAAHIICKK